MPGRILSASLDMLMQESAVFFALGKNDWLSPSKLCQKFYLPAAGNCFPGALFLPII